MPTFAFSRPWVLILGIVLGLVAGLSLTGYWPHVPLHAVATHGQDNFAIATGSIDENVEALYFLDFLTGDLTAGVIQNRGTTPTGKFNARFTRNIVADFGGLETRNPKFLMVTGDAGLPRGRLAFVPSRAFVYVAEATTGLVAVYMVPWNPALQAAGQGQVGNLMLVDVQKFRTQQIRQDE